MNKLLLAIYFVFILLTSQISLWMIYHGEYLVGAFYIPFIIFGIYDFVKELEELN